MPCAHPFKSVAQPLWICGVIGCAGRRRPNPCCAKLYKRRILAAEVHADVAGGLLSISGVAPLRFPASRTLPLLGMSCIWKFGPADGCQAYHESLIRPWQPMHNKTSAVSLLDLGMLGCPRLNPQRNARAPSIEDARDAQMETRSTPGLERSIVCTHGRHKRAGSSRR